MLTNIERFMICIDEMNAIFIFKNEFLFELGNGPAITTIESMEIRLNDFEKDRVLEMEDFVLNIEKRFLEGSHLYPKNAKRKIFYSGQSDIYFVLEWSRGGINPIVHPFKSFDNIYFGEKSSDADELISSIALELGVLSYDPVASKLLDKV